MPQYTNAIEWWKSLSSQDRARLLTKHYPNQEWFVVEFGTNNRIELMYMLETTKKTVKK